MTDPASPSSPDPSRTPDPALSRVVRVFISSTFRDFSSERDLLMKRAFPELRRRARSRFVEVIVACFRCHDGIEPDWTTATLTSDPVINERLKYDIAHWCGPHSSWVTTDFLENIATNFEKSHD